jgi:diguanylate cyclase (GGDEF)-like protein
MGMTRERHPLSLARARAGFVLPVSLALLAAFVTSAAMVLVGAVGERDPWMVGACFTFGASLILGMLYYRPFSTFYEARAARRLETGAFALAAFGLASTLDLDQLLGMIARQLSEVVEVGRCTIYLVRPDRLVAAATTDDPGDGGSGQRPLLDRTFAAGLRDAVVVDPAHHGANRAAMQSADARRVLVLPLLSPSGSLGVACLDEPGKEGSFPAHRVTAGLAVASFAALTANNASLYRKQAELAEQLRERSSQLEALLQLGAQLRATYDLDELLQSCGRAVQETLRYNEVAIYLYDEETESFMTRVALGGSSDVNQALLEQPIPRSVIDGFLREDFRLGNSYFRSQLRRPSTAEERFFFPCTDLGDRGPHEWQTDDTLLAPLWSRDQKLLGILDLYDPADRRRPTLDVVHVVEIFANQAAIAIENALQYREIEVQERRLARQLTSQRDLLAISESVLSTLDERAILDTIADTLASVIEYDALSIAKVDEQAGELVSIFARDEWQEEVLSFRIKLGEGLSGWVAVNNQAVLCNDVLTDPRVVQVPNTPVEPQASIVVPLAIRDKVIGVLCLDRLGERTFDEEELDLTKLFANLAAIAMENAALYEKSRQRAVTDSLTGLYNHGYLQELIQREIRRSERYPKQFSLLMLDLDHFKEVNDRFGHQRGDKVLKKVAAILTSCCRDTDYVARYGGDEFMVLLPETSSEDARRLAERVRTRVNSLKVASDESGGITASAGIADYPACGVDATVVVSAADTALLWAKRHGRDRCFYYRDIRDMVLSVPSREEGFRRTGIDVLAAAVDAKTSFREGHSESVAAMAACLAREMGLSPEDVEQLSVAARLHDVGKIGVPAEIFEKRGELSEAEWAEIRRHPRMSVDILASAGAPRELWPIVLYHHERWDGRGYPEGLRGEEIPLQARLLAVCDAFQAMISNRPYRGSRTVEEVCAELHRQAGQQFDPHVVDVFLARCIGVGEPSKQTSPQGGGEVGLTS